MALSGPLQVTLVCLVTVALFILNEHVDGDRTFQALPPRLQILVAAVGMSPYILLFRGYLPSGIVADTVVAIVASLTLWLVAPLVAARLTDATPTGGDRRC
ncbi:MAG: hypothetical protein ABEJ57_07180 [Halobacteriaceae archaeon]